MPLPWARVIDVALTDPVCGSLRWCILRPPRPSTAGQTSTQDTLRPRIIRMHPCRAEGHARLAHRGARGAVQNPGVVYNTLARKGLTHQPGELPIGTRLCTCMVRFCSAQNAETGPLDRTATGHGYVEIPDVCTCTGAGGPSAHSVRSHTKKANQVYTCASIHHLETDTCVCNCHMPTAAC